MAWEGDMKGRLKKREEVREIDREREEQRHGERDSLGNRGSCYEPYSISRILRWWLQESNWPD